MSSGTSRSPWVSLEETQILTQLLGALGCQDRLTQNSTQLLVAPGVQYRLEELRTWGTQNSTQHLVCYLIFKIISRSSELEEPIVELSSPSHLSSTRSFSWPLHYQRPHTALNAPFNLPLFKIKIDVLSTDTITPFYHSSGSFNALQSRKLQVNCFRLVRVALVGLARNGTGGRSLQTRCFDSVHLTLTATSSLAWATPTLEHTLHLQTSG